MVLIPEFLEDCIILGSLLSYRLLKKDGEHWKGMGVIDFFMLVDMKVVNCI